MKKLLIDVYWWLQRKRMTALGCKVGNNVKINGRPAVRIKPGGRIALGNDVCINTTRRSNPLNVENSTSFFAGPGATLDIADRAGISGSQIIAYSSITIGPETLIGAGCLICDSDMHEVPLGSKSPIRIAPIQIGSKVFIGARCIILKGVTIGDGAVIAAGSVIKGDVAPRTLVGGNPAVQLKSYPSPEVVR